MAVSFVGAAAAAATSLTLPTHQAGDLLLVFAYRSGSTTPPSVPTGWQGINQGGNNNNAAVLAFRVASASGTASGTWTNATHLVAHAYRSDAGALAIGANAATGGSSGTLSYGAVTLQDSDGSSWVAGFGGHRQAENLEDAPAGMVNRTSTGTTGGEAAGHDTDGGVTTWAAQTVTVSPSSGGQQGWRTSVVEVREVLDRALAAGVGALALSGAAAGLVLGFSLQAGTGTLAATGQQAQFLRTYELHAEPGALALDGEGTITARSWQFPVDAGALQLASGDSQGRIGFGLPAGTGTLTLAGGDVGSSRSYAVTPAPGQLLLAGEATLARTYRFAAQPGALQVTGSDIRFTLGRTVPPWAPGRAYAVGEIVGPIGGTRNGLVFKAISGGTSSASEPLWPTSFGATLTDGSVTWRVVSRLAGDLQEAAPGSIIEVFQLELTQALHGVNETYYFHAGAAAGGTNQLTWRGQTYMALPVEADGFEYTGQGQLPRPKIRVSNVLSTLSAIILTLPNGLDGAKVTRIRTLARYLDGSNFPGGQNPFGTPDSTAEFPREIYFVDRKTVENRDIVEFELAAALDLAGVRAPKRQCIANVCQWVYRSPECGYTGTAYFNDNDDPVGSLAQDECGKRVSSCRKRFGQRNELPYGSFPGIGSFFT